MSFTLEVGKTYLTATDDEVAIVRYIKDADHMIVLFVGDNNVEYFPSGRLNDAVTTPMDLVKEKPGADFLLLSEDGHKFEFRVTTESKDFFGLSYGYTLVHFQGPINGEEVSFTVPTLWKDQPATDAPQLWLKLHDTLTMDDRQHRDEPTCPIVVRGVMYTLTPNFVVEAPEDPAQ